MNFSQMAVPWAAMAGVETYGETGDPAMGWLGAGVTVGAFGAFNLIAPRLLTYSGPEGNKKIGGLLPFLGRAGYGLGKFGYGIAKGPVELGARIGWGATKIAGRIGWWGAKKLGPGGVATMAGLGITGAIAGSYIANAPDYPEPINSYNTMRWNQNPPAASLGRGTSLEPIDIQGQEDESFLAENFRDPRREFLMSTAGVTLGLHNARRG